jgi:hypothetical protein
MKMTDLWQILWVAIGFVENRIGHIDFLGKVDKSSRPCQKPGHTDCKPPFAGSRLQYHRADGVDKFPVPGVLCRGN